MEDGCGRVFSPLVLLNLVCLDAPLVAVSWAWLFAHSFEIPVARSGAIALFLSAWLIYLADRFGDSLALRPDAPTSLRQRFCLQHRATWIVAMIAVAVADLFVVVKGIEFRTLVSGAALGIFALAYLMVNQTRPSLWRRVPLKEVCIGFLFAAGTVVPLAASLTSGAWLGWLLFALLCSLNCVCIAVWERDLDQAQGRVSIATEFPMAERLILVSLGLIGLSCAILAVLAPTAWSPYVAIGVSAGLLAAVHVYRVGIGGDVRTALADLVLLTPLFVWAVTGLA